MVDILLQFAGNPRQVGAGVVFLSPHRDSFVQNAARSGPLRSRITALKVLGDGTPPYFFRGHLSKGGQVYSSSLKPLLLLFIPLKHRARAHVFWRGEQRTHTPQAQVAPYFVESCVAAGVNKTEDFNKPGGRAGVGYYQFTVRDGVRDAASRAMLGDIIMGKDLRTNLHIRTTAHVNRVLIEEATVRGVLCVRHSSACEVFVSTLVALVPLFSGGAFPPGFVA